VIARSEFGDDAAVRAMQRNLGADDIGQYFPAVTDDRGRSFVAGGFDAKHFHGGATGQAFSPPSRRWVVAVAFTFCLATFACLAKSLTPLITSIARSNWTSAMGAASPGLRLRQTGGRALLQQLALVLIGNGQP